MTLFYDDHRAIPRSNRQKFSPSSKRKAIKNPAPHQKRSLIDSLKLFIAFIRYPATDRWKASELGGYKYFRESRAIDVKIRPTTEAERNETLDNLHI